MLSVLLGAVARGTEQQHMWAAPRHWQHIPLLDAHQGCSTHHMGHGNPTIGRAALTAGRTIPWRRREREKHTSLLHLPLHKKSSKCLINSLGRNKNIMRKTIWLEKKMALAGSLLLAVLVHMCLAEVVIRALANGLFTCFYIAPLYVLVIFNLAAERSSSEICVKP